VADRSLLGVQSRLTAASLPRAARRAPELAPLGAIAAWFIVCAALVKPLTDVPIIDDWTYAWSVEHLLNTGELRILEISAIYPVTQILWGALFCLPFGFSFGALRLSTVALGLLGAWAFYLTLRELGFRRRLALIGTLAIATSPGVVLLTHSFMADVPVLSLSSCAALLYVRGFGRGRPAELWAAALLAICAVWVRQIAVAMPLGAAFALLLHRSWCTRLPCVVPIAAGVVGSLAAWALSGSMFGESLQQAERLARLKYVLEIGPGSYAQWGFAMLLMVSFTLSPLLLAAIAREHVRRLAMAIAAIAAFATIGCLLGGSALLDPLDHATLTVNELGMARDLIPGELPAPAYAPLASLLARAVMLCSCGMLLSQAGAWWRARRRARATASAGVDAQSGAFADRARAAASLDVAQWGSALFAMIALLHVGLIAILWLFHDRYYLVLLPSAVLLALRLLASARISTPVVACLLAFQAAVGIAGTRDALAYNQACAIAYAELRRQGIAARDIDAGWSWNGWMLYAHPDNLGPGVDRNRDVPQVTSKRALPYALASTPIPGYQVLHRIATNAGPWPSPGELLVLRRDTVTRHDLTSPLGSIRDSD
jgi:hypothetical protein